tara:strand:+ start:425 stop:760 length:336 start_codon:yes stop_codon:yes gene_type:complete
MRTQTLFNVNPTPVISTITGDTFESYPDHYKLTKGVNVSTSAVVVFVLNDQNTTASLEGSIDGTNFVNIKSVTRSGSDVLEGHTVALFPFMRVKVTSNTANSVIKVDIAYP